MVHGVERAGSASRGIEPPEFEPRGVERQALVFASRLLGGHGALAARLDVPVATLESWIDERQTLPDRELMELLDIILAEVRDRQAAPLP